MTEGGQGSADAREASDLARADEALARAPAGPLGQDGGGSEGHGWTWFRWLAGIVVTGLLALLLYCAQDFESDLSDLQDKQSEADRKIGQLESGINQLQEDNSEIKADIRQMSDNMADIVSDIAEMKGEMSSEPAPSEPEASGMSEGAPPEVLPAEATPEPEAAPGTSTKYRGMAGIIGPEYKGSRMACLDPQGDYPGYDPDRRIVAVAETLLEDFPCYCRVKVSRELEDGTTKTLEAIVADKFPGSDPNWGFNLSQASADGLDMTGSASVTVELVQGP